MPFNSFLFVFFFLAVLIVHSLPLPWLFRKCNLLIASYLFYAAWNPWFVLLLLFCTINNGAAAQSIKACDGRPRLRRAILWSNIVLNLGVLAGFKYGNQFLSLWQGAAERLGLASVPPKLN